MVKKFEYSCDFKGDNHPVTFYIGDSKKGSNPISHQAAWLASERGGKVSAELMDSLMKLKEISDTQKVPFEDLCKYVIEEIQITKEEKAKIAIAKKESDQE
ncbi:MAG: hypothetical protein ACJA0S_000270 [Rickettsiales bacterium]|jgi:hypothetical protein